MRELRKLYGTKVCQNCVHFYPQDACRAKSPVIMGNYRIQQTTHDLHTYAIMEHPSQLDSVAMGQAWL